MSSNGFVAPELSVVFLIPVKIADNLEEAETFSKIIDRIEKNSDALVQYCIPAEADEKGDTSLTDDLRVFQDCDVEYFDESYLKLKRFCRLDLKDRKLTAKRKDESQTALVKPYLTIFDVGIAVYTFWIHGLRNMNKTEIIDFCFINRFQVSVDDESETTLLAFFKKEINQLLRPKHEINEQDLLENHLCMLFVKDVPFQLSQNQKKSLVLPNAFIEKFRNDIFDIITLPERYFGVSYDYHKSRTPDFIEHVLTNLSVRNDFPVYLFDNRFLGIKIQTEKPDYGFHKRIIFNIVLYTNIVLQLLLLKEINETLMKTVKNIKNVTMGRLIKIRQAIYRYLEEYINTSVQRYEIWKKAVEDAARQVGIPDLYHAVEERLDMLNSYMNTSFQRQSNIWFVIMNTTFFFSTVFVYLDFITRRGAMLSELLIILALGILWAIAIGVYYSRYMR